jgi:hypothetical protein
MEAITEKKPLFASVRAERRDQAQPDRHESAEAQPDRCDEDDGDEHAHRESATHELIDDRSQR